VEIQGPVVPDAVCFPVETRLAGSSNAPEEIITSGGFEHHCINVGTVRFVSGHRFSDDAYT
jgi:hypothetical protein